MCVCEQNSEEKLCIVFKPDVAVNNHCLCMFHLSLEREGFRGCETAPGFRGKGY